MDEGEESGRKEHRKLETNILALEVEPRIWYW